MKITPPANAISSAFGSTGTSGGGSSGGSGGGDVGGPIGSPTVTGLQGVPVCTDTPATNDVLTFDGTAWCPAPAATTGLSSVTDGTTTVSPATSMTVPAHSLTDLGSGDASLGYLTNTYGAQDILNTVASSGAAQTLPATANVHDLTLTANCTLTLPSLVSGKACAITVILRQDGTGSRTVTWPGSVSWVTGSAPTLKTAASAVDVVTLFTLDGGTSWGGTAVGAGFSGGTPALTLSTTNSAGSASTGIRTDATIAAFDATVPTTQALGDSAATGSAGKAARRDHLHGMPSAAEIAAALGSQHAHVDNVVFSGDGSTTAWVLPVAPVDAYSVSVYVTGSRTQDWTLSGALLDTITFGSAPASAANNIVIDIVAATA